MALGRLPRPAVLVVEDDPDVAMTINDVVEEEAIGRSV